MTSQINFDAIDTTFPIAGRDNDTEGFRGNFAATQAALEQARIEITELHTKAVLTAQIGSNTAQVNNLHGSTLSNGLYSQLSGVVVETGYAVAEEHPINVDQGPMQVLEINDPDLTLTFRNWATTAYDKVRIHLYTSSQTIVTGTLLTSENNGNIIKEVGFPTLSLPADGKHFVIEAWTYDVTPSAGGNIYVKYLGTF